MLLHTGNGKSATEKDIIGIFDIDNATVGMLSRSFLSRAEREGRLETGTGDIPRAFLLCDGGRVLLSPLSSGTLAARLRSPTLPRGSGIPGYGKTGEGSRANPKREEPCMREMPHPEGRDP